MMDGWVCVKAPQTDKKGVFPFFFLFSSFLNSSAAAVRPQNSEDTVG